MRGLRLAVSFVLQVTVKRINEFHMSHCQRTENALEKCIRWREVVEVDIATLLQPHNKHYTCTPNRFCKKQNVTFFFRESGGITRLNPWSGTR
jgi:hypothetical protein